MNRIITIGMYLALGLTCFFAGFMAGNCCPAVHGAVVLENWELGDEISPFPFPSKTISCDDTTYYTLLYIKGANPDLEQKIMHGGNNNWAHWWLEVTDGETTYYYDYGQAYESCPEMDEIYRHYPGTQKRELIELLYDVYTDIQRLED